VRIRIIFKLRNKGATLPFQHQHLILGFIEKLMQDKGFDLYNKVLLNFSGLKGQIKVGRTGVSYLSARVTLVMSSLSKPFVDAFLQELFKHKLLELGEVILTPEYVEKEITPELKNSMKYICLGALIPHIFADQADSLLATPSTEALSDMLYESTMHRMEKSGLYTAEEIEQFFQFQLIPDQNYLDKMNIFEKKTSRSYFIYKNGELNQEIIGYTFPFELYAHPKVQHFIFHSGFGEFTNQGYGMLDVANTDHHDRVLPYREFMNLRQEENANENTNNAKSVLV
jgi:CRISPR-associated endoribonuclease Cas6